MLPDWSSGGGLWSPIIIPPPVPYNYYYYYYYKVSAAYADPLNGATPRYMNMYWCAFRVVCHVESVKTQKTCCADQ